jgi:hypothetical protein
MPVIRGRPSQTQLPDDRRSSLLARLTSERVGATAPGGPVIFELPLTQTNKFDVMVVWDEWKDVRSEDRTQLIKEVYQDKADALALALGVTRKEADEQGVLPYKVRMTFVQQPRFTEDQFQAACLSVGGFVGPDGRSELRFPTAPIAEEAALRLKEKLPGSEWVVNYSDG